MEVHGRRPPRANGLQCAAASPTMLEKAMDEVRARRFVLVDINDKERAALATGDGGAPRLELYDANGKTRASLHMDGDGSPNLYLVGPEGHVRTTLSLEADGSPILSLFDASGKIVWKAP